MSAVAHIALRNSATAYAVVDADLADWLRQWQWSLDGRGYVCRGSRVGGAWRAVYLHRAILELRPGDSRQGDHINHDKLDNRRSNLRVVTNAENGQNRAGADRGSSSRYRGVGWHKLRGKWVAYAALNGHQYNLGYFHDEDEAGRVSAAWRAEHMPFSDEAAA